MHSSTTLAAMAIMAGSAAAKVIQIDVGKGGFTFSPSSSTADVGDTLEFHFYSSLHTAVQGDFSTPCSRGSLESTGFNSGRVNNMPDGSPNVFQVPVTSTDPIWFYCSTPSHCQGGMAGVVNAPSSGGNTLDAYMSAAAGTSSSEGSTTVQGGNLVPVGTQPSSVAAGGASSSSSAAPASSSAASVESTASSEASSASSEASSASSAAAGGASTTASAASGGSSSTAAAGSPSTSATPTTASTSGAGNVQESIFKAQGLWAGIAAGLGLVVFFMA